MSVVKNGEPEYQTAVIGAASLVKGILDGLGVAQTIDRFLKHQPEVPTTYGALAQVIIVNRMSFQPQPLYQLGPWAQEHGIHRLLDLDPAWLDDDRLGAMLEALADQQVSIWGALSKGAIKKFQVPLDWLHADTTSVYFEGAYQDQGGNPKGGEERVPRLVEGYNKDGQRHKVQYVLSLTTSGRVPVWYRPWDGNQTDDGVYLADLQELRHNLLSPENAVLIGDCKLSSRNTLVTFCRQGQQFLAAHPWTPTAKKVWLETLPRLDTGELAWQEVEYVSRNQARRSKSQQNRYLVCAVPQQLPDPARNTDYPLRWLFYWSDSKADRDVRGRQKALEAGEQSLQRVARLVGKYGYSTSQRIEERIEQTLTKAGAREYFQYRVLERGKDRPEALWWGVKEEALAAAERFDGIALLCTNVPQERLPDGEALAKYKEQVQVEQTIDFLKSPIQVRPMWLHSPKRLAGLTLLIMVAVLVAALLEHQVRRGVQGSGQLLRGLMPERRDNPYPTARALLRAFQDYALVVVIHSSGEEEVHYPKLQPVQQRVWEIMGLDPLPGQTLSEGSGK